jgi:hypothetical protein
VNTTLAQNITTVAVAALAWSLAYVALSANRYNRLGREALLCAASFIFLQAVTRTLSINNLISPGTARLLVGITAFFALAVLAQLAYLKRLDSRLQHKETT